MDESRSRWMRWIFVAVASVLLTGVATVVAAQESPEAPGSGGVDAQTYRPAVGAGGLLRVEGSETAEHLQPYGSLFFDVFSDPLVLRRDDGTRQSVIDHRLSGHLLLGIGVGDRFQFELGMPMVMYDQGEYLGEPIEGAGPGDLGARAKAQILSNRDQVVGLAAMLDVTAPTGDVSAYRGSTTATATPQLIGDTRIETPAGPLVVAANTGMRFRGSETVHNLELGPEFTYGAGAELEVVPGTVRVGADLYGAVGVGDVAREKNPLEGLVGAKFEFVEGFTATVGAGAGLVGGVGSPAWRGLAGMTYRPPSTEPEEPIEEPTPPPEDDVEEVVDESVDDECPPEPDDFDGLFDEDGCPVTPETFTGCDDLDDDWEGDVDRWGCPLLDSDGDGLLVWDDECPREPIVFIGEGQEDGCPNEDVDGDGIANIDDHCPLEPGVEAYDGCPPPEDEEVVERGDEEIEIEKRVHFESNKAIIKDQSYELLDEVALVIRTNSDILLIEVAGHTDRRGDPDYNMMLSKERAKAVREFLIERGNIPGARLSAEGYGETEPLIDEDTDDAHAQNRRVEFRILEVGEEGEADALGSAE